MSHRFVCRYQSAKRSRFRAAERLYDVENCTRCFKTNQEAMVLLGKHRARSRTIWSETNKPVCGTAASEVQKTCTALQKLRDKAAKTLDSPNQAKRQHDAAWAGEWATELLSALCSLEEQATTCQTSLPQLQSILRNAASPTKRSLTGGIPNPRNVFPYHLRGLMCWQTQAGTLLRVPLSFLSLDTMPQVP